MTNSLFSSIGPGLMAAAAMTFLANCHHSNDAPPAEAASTPLAQQPLLAAACDDSIPENCRRNLSRHPDYYQNGQYIASLDELAAASKDRTCRRHAGYRTAIHSYFLQDAEGLKALSRTPQPTLAAIGAALDTNTPIVKDVEWYHLVKNRIVPADEFQETEASAASLTELGLKMAPKAMDAATRVLDEGRPYEELMQTLGVFCHAVNIFMFAVSIERIDLAKQPYKEPYDQAWNRCRTDLPELDMYKGGIKNPKASKSFAQRMREIDGLRRENDKAVKEIDRECRSGKWSPACDSRD